MDKELKARWIESLRSGKFKQAQNTLCDGEGFCCLGVLLTISNKGDWNGSMYEIEDYDDDGEKIVCDGDMDGAPCRIFGLPGDTHSALITMNDDEGKSFLEIADFIEKSAL